MDHSYMARAAHPSKSETDHEDIRPSTVFSSFLDEIASTTNDLGMIEGLLIQANVRAFGASPEGEETRKGPHEVRSGTVGQAKERLQDLLGVVNRIRALAEKLTTVV